MTNPIKTPNSGTLHRIHPRSIAGSHAARLLAGLLAIAAGASALSACSGNSDGKTNAGANTADGGGTGGAGSGADGGGSGG